MQWTAGFTFVKPEPRFRYKGSYAQLGQELYFERSWTDHGGRGFGRNRSDAYGFLGFARFRWSRAKGAAPFWDIGFGLQYASRRTHDLGGRLNSTPFLDYGYAFTVGGKEVLVGIRWLHISNGGFAARNSGQNQFSLMVSSRF